jgi:voltage-gated potassium channel
MPLQKRLTLLGVLFLVVMSAGTLGFMLVEGWSAYDAFYMTVITLYTVGYGEVHPLSMEGRWVAIMLILGGTGSLAYGMSMVTALIIEGELHNILGKRRMERVLAKLRDHVIVCGLGDTGRHVVEEFMKTRLPCVIIERNPATIKHRERFQGVPLVEGEATDEEILSRARIEVARGLVTTMPEDKDNLFVILTARGMNPKLRIVSRAIADESHEKLRKAGADAVVSANRIGGLRMASEIVRPNVVSFLDVMLRGSKVSIRFEEAEVPADSPMAGRTLAELELHKRVGLVIIAIRQQTTGNFLYNPTAGTVVERGDCLVACGEPDQLERLRSLLALGTTGGGYVD